MTDRGADGKFVKGNKASPGRMPREKEARYYDILLTSVSFDDWKAIITRATQDAKKGDAVARKWLTDYLVGPPVERKEHTGKDGGPIRYKVTLEDVADE